MTSTSVDRIYGLSSGVAIKAPVRVATTAAITLSGLQTVDGVTLVANDRVLVKNQTDATANGIYLAATSTWQRDQDFDGARDVVRGTIVFVISGTVSGGLFYEITTADPITIGTSSIAFAATNPGTPIPIPVSIAQGGTGSSTAATARTALGSTTIGDALYISASAAAARLTIGLDAALTNSRLAKTALYTVLNADKGRTIALGGSAFYTLTFGAASGYDANFTVFVVNEDSGRGKTIAASGMTSFILWPGQSAIVSNENNTWRVTPLQQRWAKSGAVYHVDPLLGNDSNDGLATGAGAFLTIQGAYNVMRTTLDTLGGPPTINLADGTYSVGAGVNINYNLVGGAQFSITGNNATPANVVISCNGAGNCFNVRDGGATVTLSGMTLSTIGNGSTAISVSQNAVVDICASGPVNFNAFPLGVHMACATWASINVLGPYEIFGSAVTHIAVSANAYINYGSFTVTGVSNLTFTTFGTAVTGGLIEAGGAAMAFSGFGSVTGKRYAAEQNGVIDSAAGAASYPGNSVGTTATGGQAS